MKILVADKLPEALQAGRNPDQLTMSVMGPVLVGVDDADYRQNPIHPRSPDAGVTTRIKTRDRLE